MNNLKTKRHPGMPWIGSPRRERPGPNRGLGRRGRLLLNALDGIGPCISRLSPGNAGGACQQGHALTVPSRLGLPFRDRKPGRNRRFSAEAGEAPPLDCLLQDASSQPRKMVAGGNRRKTRGVAPTERGDAQLHGAADAAIRWHHRNFRHPSSGGYGSVQETPGGANFVEGALHAIDDATARPTRLQADTVEEIGDYRVGGDPWAATPGKVVARNRLMETHPVHADDGEGASRSL